MLSAQLSKGSLPSHPTRPLLPTQRVHARRHIVTRAVSDDESSHTTPQTQLAGLGLALVLGASALPASAASVQGLQTITQSPHTTQAASQAASFMKRGAHLAALEGPSVGESLTKAFTSSPPQAAGKSRKAVAPPDLIRGRFGLLSQIAGGVALLLASSVLAVPNSAKKDASKAASRGAKSSARKLSSPVKGAQQLASRVPSPQGSLGKLKGGTQRLSKQQPSKSGIGSQLQRVKSSGTAAAKGAQQKAPQGGLVAGVAVAGLVVGSLLFGVLPKPGATPDSVGDASTSLQQTASETASGAKGFTDALAKGAPNKEPTTDQGLDPKGPQQAADEAFKSE